jgi:hypothetical protein
VCIVYVQYSTMPPKDGSLWGCVIEGGVAFPPSGKPIPVFCRSSSLCEKSPPRYRLLFHREEERQSTGMGAPEAGQCHIRSIIACSSFPPYPTTVWYRSSPQMTKVYPGKIFLSSEGKSGIIQVWDTVGGRSTLEHLDSD